MTKEQYLFLLGARRKKDHLQDPTGLLLLTLKGEQIAAHYSFYAAFSMEEEYRT